MACSTHVKCRDVVYVSGPRISVVVHDGSRILDRKRIGHEAKDLTAMEITKSFYQTEVITYKGLGDEVVAIGDLKKDKDQGFQLYLAIEVGGKVVEMGLPFIKNKSGEDLFLSPANIKPGDLESIAPNLPAGAEILMVWRLDKGMDQDIVVTNDSIISSVAPPQALGADYSMLDKKACISCGGGASSKFDFVVDVMEVKLFCGGQEDPIRMSTLMVPAPEAFLFDAAPMHPVSRPIEQGIQDTRNQASPGNVIADVFARTSWEDSVKLGESFLSSFSIYYNRQVAISDPRVIQQDEKPIRFDAGTTIVLFRMPKEKGLPILPVPALNPSEKRLWLEIHGRKEASQPIEKHQNRYRPIQQPPSLTLLEGVQGLPIAGPASAASPIMKARPLHLHLSLQADPGPVQITAVPPKQAQIPSSKEISRKADAGIPVPQKSIDSPRNSPAGPKPSQKTASQKAGSKEKAQEPIDARVQKPKKRSSKPLPHLEEGMGAKDRAKCRKEKNIQKAEPGRKPLKASIPKAVMRKSKRIRSMDQLITASMPKLKESRSITKKKAGRADVHLFNEMMGVHAHSSRKRGSKGKARKC